MSNTVQLPERVREQLREHHAVLTGAQAVVQSAQQRYNEMSAMYQASLAAIRAALGVPESWQLDMTTGCFTKPPPVLNDDAPIPIERILESAK